MLELERCIPRSDLDDGYTGNRYPLWVHLTAQLLKSSLVSESMEIPLSVSKLSITINASMIQLYNISLWGNHQSRSQNMVKDQDLKNLHVWKPSDPQLCQNLRVFEESYTTIQSIRCKVSTDLYLVFWAHKNDQRRCKKYRFLYRWC